jgi:hypothetical protein
MAKTVILIELPYQLCRKFSYRDKPPMSSAIRPTSNYSVIDDGRVFTIALLSSLTWTTLRHDSAARTLGLGGSLLASMILIYVFGLPLARLGYFIAGRRPIAARFVFTVVTLTVIALLARGQ